MARKWSRLNWFQLRLTMKVYTDANTLPAAEGIEKLPSLIKEGPHIGPHDLVTGCRNVSSDGTTSPKLEPPKSLMQRVFVTI